MSDTEERPTSVREDLVAAFEAQEVSETETDTAPEPVADQKEEPAQDKSAEAPKAEETKEAAPKNQAVEEEPDGKLEAPERWTKEQKEEFEALDPGIQRILLARNKGLEGSYTKQMQQIAQERQRYHGIEQVLAPHRQSWNGTGWDDATALNNIMGYWQHAQQDPMGFIAQFAEARGLDLASHFAPSTDEILAYLNQQDGAGEGTQPSPVHPDVARQMQTLQSETQQLRQQLAQQQGYQSQQQQQRMAQERAEAARLLEEFQSATDESGNAKYEFLEDLRMDMSQLLGNGMAQDLQEAYDKALWMRPDIREKRVESMQMQQRREMERQLREEGEKARVASSSVVGSTSTPVPIDEDDGDGSVRSILERQWRAQMQQDV